MLKSMHRSKSRWSMHQWIRLVAGSLILISLLLSLIHPNWLFLTAFVGLNLLQSAFTNWCPLIALLRRMGVSEG
ncbi:YgaP family membrane protein [Leptodesmis sp.]|uniref:YgaP family membrane protein n=1 Tax=Leptodesmis sp. TaxID=3100501 RepID=UPI00405352E8